MPEYLEPSPPEEFGQVAPTFGGSALRRTKGMIDICVAVVFLLTAHLNRLLRDPMLTTLAKWFTGV